MSLERFHAVFVEEAAEHLDIIENGLLQLEKTPADEELLNTVFRSVHTIKGSSGTVGLPDISTFTHLMEELLELMRSGVLLADQQIISTLLSALDLIKEMVAAVGSAEGFCFSCCHELMQQMNTIRNGAQNKTDDQKTVAVQSCESNHQLWFVRFAPPANLFQRGGDPLKFIEELRLLGTVKHLVCETDKVPRLAELDCEELYLAWHLELETSHSKEDILEVFEFIADESLIEVSPITEGSSKALLLGKLLVEEGVVSAADVQQALSKQKKLGEILIEEGKASPAEINGVLEKQAGCKSEQVKKTVATSIRVDLQKLDHLVNLVGEMVINHSMFQQVMYGQVDGEHKGNSARIDAIFAQLQRIGKDIQESTMALRMLPVGEVFQRFTRLVREISSHKGKNIELLISGEETELDKGVLEKIADPLVHLIRNAVDHGIETPKERLSAGKIPQATLMLRAYQMGDAVYIDVQDDGRGLDCERIVAKAMEKGLIPGAGNLSDEEACKLIMLPGFSTADKVSDISGRGVGMDVVCKNIEALNGTVQLKTAKGKGTTVSIRLPLTLAIIDGLTVGIGSEIFIIPIASVLESLRPLKSEVGSISEQGMVVNVRGERIPLIRLHKLLSIPCHKTDPCEAIVVVTHHDSKKYGLLVDELLGEQQIVLKNLGSATPKVTDIAGGTIMGDGQVALVLDVAGVISRSRK